MYVNNVNMFTPCGFQGKERNVEKVVDKAFGLLLMAKKNKLPIYLGTTKKGENVYIKETKLGKNADLYVSYETEDVPKFDIFHLSRVFGAGSTVTKGETGKVSSSEVGKLRHVLDSLV